MYLRGAQVQKVNNRSAIIGGEAQDGGDGGNERMVTHS